MSNIKLFTCLTTRKFMVKVYWYIPTQPVDMELNIDDVKKFLYKPSRNQSYIVSYK